MKKRFDGRRAAPSSQSTEGDQRRDVEVYRAKKSYTYHYKVPNEPNNREQKKMNRTQHGHILQRNVKRPTCV